MEQIGSNGEVLAEIVLWTSAVVIVGMLAFGLTLAVRGRWRARSWKPQGRTEEGS